MSQTEGPADGGTTSQLHQGDDRGRISLVAITPKQVLLFFGGKKVGKKSVVVVFFVFLAVGGQFRPFETLRFAVTFQTVPIPSLTSPCSLNFAQFFGFLILEN